MLRPKDLEKGRYCPGKQCYPSMQPERKVPGYAIRTIRCYNAIPCNHAETAVNNQRSADRRVRVGRRSRHGCPRSTPGEEMEVGVLFQGLTTITMQSGLFHAPPTRVLPRLRHVVAQCCLVHLREQSTTGRGVSARMRVYVRACVRTSVSVSVCMHALA
jgi:hypothetical protein